MCQSICPCVLCVYLFVCDIKSDCYKDCKATINFAPCCIRHMHGILFYWALGYLRFLPTLARWRVKVFHNFFFFWGEGGQAGGGGVCDK